MFTVALSGGIGCGKTTVCEIFAQQGVCIIDTDIISRKLVEPGQSSLLEITQLFGEQVLNDNGTLNRKALASRIFTDKDLREQLEAILHPRIRQDVKQQIKQANSDYCIVAIPLLFETGQQSEYDRSLVIDCTEQQQIDRTRSRDNRSQDEILSIMKSQISRTERLALADDVIDNSNGFDSLTKQVTKLHNKYLDLSSHSIR